jgi:hypothetical protein
METVWVAIITALGAIIAAAIQALVDLRKERLKREAEKEKETRRKSPTRREKIRAMSRVNWRNAIIAAIVGAVIGGGSTYLVVTRYSASSTGCEIEIPEGATKVEQIRIGVSADQYWYDTGIRVEQGDWLELTAEGKWWSGISETGPDGDKGGLFGIGRPSCGSCPVVGGNLGELVGKVEGDFPFRIGRCQTEEMQTDGAFLLAMNENTGPCKDNREGSCYDDNNGSLQVTIIVWRIQ